MKYCFKVSVKVDRPIVAGQDTKNGRRQLIPILSGTVTGEDLSGNSFSGKVMPGGVDSQIIRPDGKCELSARYAVELEDGRSFYIENNGIRTVPAEYAPAVFRGEFVPPEVYYFATTPIMEAYDDSLRWLEDRVFICKARREPDRVEIDYFMVD